MSWFRQIKTLYSSTYVLMMYIIWTLLSCMFLGNQLSFNIYIIVLFTVFLMEYLYDKEYKKHITLSVPLIIGAIVLGILYEPYKAILNYIFLVVSIIVIYRDESSQVHYYEYRNKWIAGAYIMLAISMVALLYSPQLLGQLFRVYVMYLVMVVINLRESLRYSYNINSKYSKYINFGIITFIIAIFQEYTYKIFTLIVNKIFVLVNYAMNLILSIIIKILSYPIAYGTKFFNKLFSRGGWVGNSLLERFQLIKITNKDIFEQDTFRDDASVIFVFTLLKIMLAIGVFIIVIRIISNLGKVEKRESGYVEFKEKLDNKKKNNEGFIQKLRKTLFRKRGNFREEILYNYSEFERVTEKAQIFKPYMTASQLKNVTKIKVDNIDKLDDLTDIYNKAKFSEAELKSENLDTVKKAVGNIKSQLKS